MWWREQRGVAIGTKGSPTGRLSFFSEQLRKRRDRDRGRKLWPKTGVLRSGAQELPTNFKGGVFKALRKGIKPAA